MFHDQYVSHKWHVFIILFFMSCPEPPMGKSSVGSFPVQSGGSQPIYFFPGGKILRISTSKIY